MPTYEYRCQDCSHIFEIFATLKQKEAGLQPECPECHSADTRQDFRSVMFIRGSSGGSTMPAGCRPNMGPGCC